ncbi:MAG TPA: sensor histidine kinase [Chloroflexi bacterium]|nr:sensor histidine kinase [Chloroflexota bacterium]
MPPRGYNDSMWAGGIGPPEHCGDEIGRMLVKVAPLFQFAQGLTFFVLGMAILLTTPRAGRLEIGRRLPLLAVFAFCEAAVVWDGTLASAASAAYVVPPLLQAALLALGYGALLAFGLLVPVPLGRRSRTRLGLLAVLLVLWLAGVLFSALGNTPSTQIAFWGEIAARYGFAFPGGLLALWGLRCHTSGGMDPRMLRLTEGSLRAVGIALGTFGVIAGLILPSISISADTWAVGQRTETLSIIISLILTLCGVALTYGLMRTLNIIQWEVEHWIEGVEQSLALAADRERIGRELHDGIIQSIYAAGLMLEGARQLIPEDSVAAKMQLSQAMRSLNHTIQDIRRYIFDLRGEEPKGGLVRGLEELLRDFRVNTLLETGLVVKGKDTHPLDVERQRHVFQIVREALSNVARHAQARRVEVRLFYEPDRLQLQIADDGVGLAIIPTTRGQGLRNIRERARLLGGTVDIGGVPGQGVTLTLIVPYSGGEML